MAIPVALRLEGTPWGRVAAGIVAASLVLAALAAACAVDRVADLRPGPNEYNVAAWEVRNFPNKWLLLLGDALRGGPGAADEERALRRFFEVSTEIEALERQGGSAGPDAATAARLEDLQDERDALENRVEAIIEGRLHEVIEAEGLTRSFLVDVVWPPVDAEFTEAPRTLATSPRDRIELKDTTLLREDLSLAEAVEIEEETAAREDVAALTFSTAGIGAYPTIIDYPGSYERAVEVIAHEWMHNYLFFRPLGFNYYASNDVRTMNETVADLVARELAQAVLARWPLTDEAPTTDSASTPPEEGVDLGEELRKLRGEVDVLLAEGKIEEAEALMEQRRQELQARGFFIRKINQAYFAYLNLYAGEAGSAAATNPIGPKIDELRRLSASLEQFVDIAGGLTSVEELDRRLEDLR